MKTMKFIASLAAVILVAVLFVRCTEDAATPITNYSISGAVTYPSFNGADGNHAPMHGNVTTFAQVLQDEFNYTTSYMGKVCMHMHLRFVLFCFFSMCWVFT